MTRQHPDKGFTLIEVLLVIVVLGILGTVVVASVGGFSAEAADRTCAAERRSLYTAVEGFRATPGNEIIPAADASADGHERTLVQAGFLREVSSLYDVQADGTLVPAPGGVCGP
jgi:prepilin-type N-terminal cleavage/methylation domain-containing protein